MPEATNIKMQGTRFHRVAVLDGEHEVLLIATVSTPLTSGELHEFIENRLLGIDAYVTECEKPADSYKPGIIGLSTLEEWLKKLLPEQVIEELSVTITDRGMHIKRKEEECK